MVAGGPNPGRIPTIVPRKTPTKHQSRLAGLSATENPKTRLLSASNFGYPFKNPEDFWGQKVPVQRQKSGEIQHRSPARSRWRSKMTGLPLLRREKP